MNPSATDWIPKFLNRFEKQQLVNDDETEDFFYDKLKLAGFIYGVSVDAIPDEEISQLKLTREELTKINLFHAMIFTHSKFRPERTFKDAITSIVDFYATIEKGKTGFFKKLTLSQNPSNNLEKIFAARLNESNNFLKNNSTLLITYALLYVDVLAFRVFLNSPSQLKSYIQDLENTIISFSFLALTSKNKKNKYDIQLLELFESSSDYIIRNGQADQTFTLEGINYLTKKDTLEKRYLLDLCILSINDDHKIDDSEYKFLRQLSAILQFSEIELKQSIEDLRAFSKLNSTKIQLFEYSSPINQFYKQSTKTVKTLILRNKNRLAKELEESGELVILLGQSALRELNHEEKTKVKEQLLDVCKTIPSLTIFLLPGGTLLLPLLVKLIPKLLPSSFNENRIDKNK
jgi:hypothetical protein